MTTVLHGNIKRIALMAGMAACSVFADEAMVRGVNWRYSVSGNKACIDGLANMSAAGGQSAEARTRKMIMEKICDKNLVIPGKIGKYPVTSIGEMAINLADGPVSIVVPKTVTSIGTGAFLGNPHLQSVFLPPKLTSVPEALFHTCENLKSVTIPLSVKSIGVEAFAECRSLKSMEIPKGVVEIGRLAFRDCSNLASVTIPSSVTNIGELAFANCPKLSVIYAEAGKLAQLKTVIALHNRDEDISKARIEEKAK